MNAAQPLPPVARDERVRVDLGRRSYDIVIGEDLLARAGPLVLPLLAQRRVIVVSDERVPGCTSRPFAASLDACGIAHHSVVLPAGEQTKDFAHLRGLCEGFSRSASSAAPCSSRWAVASSAISSASPPAFCYAASISCRCRRPCWRKWIARWAARPASTRRKARTWSACSTSRAWCWRTSRL